MSDFDSSGDRPLYRRSAAPSGPSWLSMFTSTFAGSLLAGIILLIGVRFYVYWSIRDAGEQIKEKLNKPAVTAPTQK